ncbi:MAG: hypothetical protein LBT64_03830, partial [Puniceicoccales bacterium]|nr:hypothetical protein [Puniceicoccales bacterium]
MPQHLRTIAYVQAISPDATGDVSYAGQKNKIPNFLGTAVAAKVGLGYSSYSAPHDEKARTVPMAGLNNRSAIYSETGPITLEETTSIPQEKIVATDDAGKGYTAKDLAQALSGYSPHNNSNDTDIAATFIGKYLPTILPLCDKNCESHASEVGKLITVCAPCVSAMEQAGVPRDAAMAVIDVALEHLIENLKITEGEWPLARKFCEKQVQTGIINAIAATKGLDASTAGATMKECEKNYSAISEHNKSFFSIDDSISQGNKMTIIALAYAKKHGDAAGKEFAKKACELYTQCYDIGYSNGENLGNARTCALKGITGFLCEVNDGKDIN